MSKKDQNVAYAAELYNEEDVFVKGYVGRLNSHSDTVSLEMQGSLNSISQVLADEEVNVKNLLVVTDSKTGYERFTGQTTAVRERSARSRYKARMEKHAELETKFQNLVFGRVLNEDPTMARVDAAAKGHREAMKK